MNCMRKVKYVRRCRTRHFPYSLHSVSMPLVRLYNTLAVKDVCSNSIQLISKSVNAQASKAFSV